MMKNNVIEEIKELVRQIKSNWQEGVDFQIPYWSLKGGSGQAGAIHHLSPRLKSFLRKKFDFPFGVNDYLDFSKVDSAGNSYYYRLDGEHGEGEFEGLYVRYSNKGLEQEKPKNCAVCGKLTMEEEGRMWLWNKLTIGKEFGQESKVIGYFHPECAKKYFADKQQPIKNNTRIKEKLLRNLDKICLDPNGYLANNEYLKTDKAEEEYHKLFNSDLKGWKERYLKIVIEDEEIDLEIWDNSCPEYYEVKKALIQKIKSEIKKNPSEWKIKVGKEKNYSVESNNRLIKHISGQKHWKYAISYLWGDNNNESSKHWAEITSQLSEISDNDLINNSQSNQNNHQLAISLTLGSGVVLVGIIYLFATKKRKNNKYK